MEQQTEEINALPTQEEINKRLDLLTKTHFLDDQANCDFKKITEDGNSTRSEITAALYHRKETEDQYVRLSKWLWANTPRGIRFDHSLQKYVLR